MTQQRVSIGAGPMANRSGLARFARRFWALLRELTGDASYERYLGFERRAASRNPLSESEFYLDRLRRRYSSINRCC